MTLVVAGAVVNVVLSRWYAPPVAGVQVLAFSPPGPVTPRYTYAPSTYADRV